MARNVALDIGITGHHQRRSGLDQHARRNVVDGAQIVLAQAHALGCFGHGDGGGYGPDGPAGKLPFVVGLEVAAKDLGVVPGQQNLGRGTRKDHGLVKARVQGLEVFDADVGQLGDQLHVDVVGNFHGLEVGVVLNDRKLGVELLRGCHDVFDGLELGDVVAGFRRHLQVQVARGLAQLFIALNGAAHAAFAPVVGGQCQVPVAKYVVELLQIVERSAGGGQHVAAVIAECVLLEVEIRARGRHELPHAGGLGAGDRLRVEGALDKRQQGQLGWHIPALQLLDDVEQVFARSFRHALDVLGAAAIPLLMVLHQILLKVGHGKALANTHPEVARGFKLGDFGVAHFAFAQRFERAIGVHGVDATGRGAAGQNQHAGKQQGGEQFHQKTFFHWRKEASTLAGSSGLV